MHSLVLSFHLDLAAVTDHIRDSCYLTVTVAAHLGCPAKTGSSTLMQIQGKINKMKRQTYHS